MPDCIDQFPIDLDLIKTVEDVFSLKNSSQKIGF
jgi:hypothetical protein